MAPSLQGVPPKEKISLRERVSNKQLQDGSVQIYGTRIGEWGVREFDHLPGLFAWELGYDPFLGFMAGVLPLVDGSAMGYVI